MKEHSSNSDINRKGTTDTSLLTHDSSPQRDAEKDVLKSRNRFEKTTKYDERIESSYQTGMRKIERAASNNNRAMYFHEQDINTKIQTEQKEREKFAAEHTFMSEENERNLERVESELTQVQGIIDESKRISAHERRKFDREIHSNTLDAESKIKDFDTKYNFLIKRGIIGDYLLGTDYRGQEYHPNKAMNAANDLLVHAVSARLEKEKDIAHIERQKRRFVKKSDASIEYQQTLRDHLRQDREDLLYDSSQLKNEKSQAQEQWQQFDQIIAAEQMQQTMRKEKAENYPREREALTERYQARKAAETPRRQNPEHQLNRENEE